MADTPDRHGYAPGTMRPSPLEELTFALQARDLARWERAHVGPFGPEAALRAAWENETTATVLVDFLEALEPPRLRHSYEPTTRPSETADWAWTRSAQGAPPDCTCEDPDTLLGELTQPCARCCAAIRAAVECPPWKAIRGACES